MSEHQEQVALREWADAKGHPFNLLFAIPNGGQRHVIVARKLKAEGVRSGIPDMFLPVPRNGYHGLFIELKTLKGRATKSQLEWLQKLADQNYMAVCCKGWDAARETIEGYMR